MTEEELISALERTKMLIEKEIYTQMTIVGIDPEAFDFDSFENDAFIASAPENLTPTEWIAYTSTARLITRLKDVQNKIEGMTGEV